MMAWFLGALVLLNLGIALLLVGTHQTWADAATIYGIELVALAVIWGLWVLASDGPYDY